MKFNTHFKLLVVAIAMLSLTGCLGGAGRSGGTAQVALYLTDTAQSLEPATLGFEAAQANSEIDEIWVTISAVHARRSKGGWEKLFDIPEAQGLVNLTNLRLRKELLGNDSIPAGKYTEIRFEVRENQGDHETDWYNFVVVNGQKSPLKVPSTELKVDVDMEITLTNGAMAELVFDVDSRFLVERGSNGYIANPRKAVRFIKSYTNAHGSINGEIKLPPGTNKWLSIDVELVRLSDQSPVWHTELRQDDKLQFELNAVPLGTYEFRVSVELFHGVIAIEFESDPIVVEKANPVKSVLLEITHP